MASNSGTNSSANIMQTPITPLRPSAKPSPSFARSTASSSIRASLSPKIAKQSTPPKRPSTLTGTDRQLALLLQQTRSLTIKPANPSLPCPLATIPPDIRYIIYSYILPRASALPSARRTYSPNYYWSNYGRMISRYLWPILLRVCRAIRMEAAHEYYARTTFIAYASNHDFSDFTTWVRKLPVQHRIFLTRNRRIVISLKSYDFTVYLPRTTDPDSASTAEAWKKCAKYGNLHSVVGNQHKQHFIAFCKLCDWFLWSAKPLYEEFKFRYDGELMDTHGTYGRTKGEVLLILLKQGVGVMQLPCTQMATLKKEERVVVRKRALEMLGELDKVFQGLGRRQRGGVDREWEQRVVSLRKFLENW